jgi:hypothetical protein
VLCTAGAVAAVADRIVPLVLFWVLLTAFCAGVIAAVRPWLLSLVPPVAPAAERHEGAGGARVAGWALIAELAAGPVDAHPDSYAARAAALSPLYSDPTTTTPGGTTHA